MKQHTLLHDFLEVDKVSTNGRVIKHAKVQGEIHKNGIELRVGYVDSHCQNTIYDRASMTIGSEGINIPELERFLDNVFNAEYHKPGATKELISLIRAVLLKAEHIQRLYTRGVL